MSADVYADRIDELAMLIHRMHEDYLNRRLKRGGKDFLSGLVEAYALMTTGNARDVDAALAAALARGQEMWE